ICHANSAFSLLADYDISRRKFTGGGDAVIQSATGGVKNFFTPQFYFEARAGAGFIRSFQDENLVRPIYAATLGDDLSETSFIKINFEKKYSINAYSQDLFNHWQAGAEFSHRVSERWNGYLNAFYGSGKYVAEGVTDDLFGAGVKLAYDLTEH